jgi:Clustered mitochondria/Translation initiation factor eIF3 subunit 135
MTDFYSEAFFEEVNESGSDSEKDDDSDIDVDALSSADDEDDFETMSEQEARALYSKYNTSEAEEAMLAASGYNECSDVFKTLYCDDGLASQTQIQSQTQVNSNSNIGGRNWTEELIQLMRLNTDGASVGRALGKFESLASLANDFLETATMYGRIIINEAYSSTKTIAPCNVGGIAGGAKYIVQEILFKFAFDSQLDNGQFMYGGSAAPSIHAAMKAAGGELRSLQHFAAASMDMNEMHLPLMALVDYRGFRLIALSVLPISDATLAFGSSDGGASYRNSCAQLADSCNAACARLHLKPHSPPCDNSIKIVGPGDLEGHEVGEGDARRFYCVDFGRLFPPEAPLASVAKHTPPRSIFFRFLRPELVRGAATPLCSDALTGWTVNDPHSKEHAREVADATRWLHESIVVEFARKVLDRLAAGKRLDDEHRMLGVDAELKASRAPCFYWPRPSYSTKLASVPNGRELVLMLHSRGINLRHCGLVHAASRRLSARRALLNEAVARALKNELRARLRATAERVRVASDTPFKRIYVDFFNELLLSSGSDGGDNDSDFALWRETLPNALQADFFFGDRALRGGDDGSALDVDDASDAAKLPGAVHFASSTSSTRFPPLFGRVDLERVFERLCALTGIVLAERIDADVRACCAEARARAERQTNVGPPIQFARVLISDLVRVDTVAKHLQLMPHAAAKALFLRAMLIDDRSRFSERLELLRQAACEMRSAMRTSDATMLLHSGMIELELALTVHTSRQWDTEGVDHARVAVQLLRDAVQDFRTIVELLEQSGASSAFSASSSSSSSLSNVSASPASRRGGLAQAAWTAGVGTPTMWRAGLVEGATRCALALALDHAWCEAAANIALALRYTPDRQALVEALLRDAVRATRACVQLQLDAAAMAYFFAGQAARTTEPASPTWIAAQRIAGIMLMHLPRTVETVDAVLNAVMPSATMAAAMNAELKLAPADTMVLKAVGELERLLRVDEQALECALSLSCAMVSGDVRDVPMLDAQCSNLLVPLRRWLALGRMAPADSVLARVLLSALRSKLSAVPSARDLVDTTGPQSTYTAGLHWLLVSNASPVPVHIESLCIDTGALQSAETLRALADHVAPRLRSLEIKNALRCDAIAHFVASASHLESLAISSFDLSLLTVPLSCASTLRTLRIESCNTAQVPVDAVRALIAPVAPSLRTFVWTTRIDGDAALSGALIEQIARMTSLDHLELVHRSLGAAFVRRLAEAAPDVLARVETLAPPTASADDEASPLLAVVAERFGALRSLTLSNVHASVAANDRLGSLAALASLRSLSIDSLRSEAIEHLASPTCAELVLRQCGALTDKHVAGLVRRFPNVTLFHARNSQRVTIDALRAMAAADGWRDQLLDINMCLRGEDMVAELANFTSLRRIGSSGHDCALSSATWQRLVDACGATLESLDVWRWRSAHWHALARFPQLRSLSLHQCPLHTPGIVAVASSARSLHTLVFDQIGVISAFEAHAIVAGQQRLRLLSMPNGAVTSDAYLLLRRGLPNASLASLLDRATTTCNYSSWIVTSFSSFGNRLPFGFE